MKIERVNKSETVFEHITVGEVFEDFGGKVCVKIKDMYGVNGDLYNALDLSTFNYCWLDDCDNVKLLNATLKIEY